MKPIQVLTNFKRFPLTWSSSGYSGHAKVVTSVRSFLKNSSEADLILVNGKVPIVLWLAFIFSICPSLRKPIIAVDLVLRKPEGWFSSVGARIKKFLFSKVDHFVHYFRDLKGYSAYYGIRPERSSFVHFKANLYECFTEDPFSEGDYVLCFGRSLRDYNTFFKAMANLPYSAAIAKPNFKSLRAHGSQFSRGLAKLPVQLMRLDDDGTPASQVRIFKGARVVVIPVLKKSLCASGIGTYLNAMWMGKCVIVSEGPGVSDVLSGQALTVPPENSEMLQEAIKRAWENAELRKKMAKSGREFAEALGGEQALFQRILEAIIPKFSEAAAL